MTRNLWLLGLVLCTASWSNSTAAQTTQPAPQQWVFCDGSTPVPAGWSVYPSTANVECGPNGAGTALGADNHLRALLYADPATKLRTGRYMLTGGGAGSAFVKVFNGYADATSMDTRLRTLNLGSATPIVNAVVFDWNEAASIYGMLDIRAGGVKWLRLERQPDVPAGVAVSRACNSWPGLPASVRCTNSSAPAASRITASNGATATISKSFVLPAGRYRLTTSARGNVVAQITSGPNSSLRYTILREPIVSSGSALASLSRLFAASGQQVTLSITASSANAAFDFTDVNITPYVEATPSPATLAAQRPSPWRARGINSPDAAQSMSAAPQDFAGNPCTRFPVDSNNALFEMKAWGAQIARTTLSTTSRVKRAGCQLLRPTDIYADGTMSRDRFWADAWPRILSEAEAALRTAESAGLKVVLTLEPPTPGAKLDDGTPTGWVNLRARSDYARGMREMAQRLAPLRHVIWAYELANEPYEIINSFGNVAASQYRHLAIELIEAVRQGEASAQVPASQKSFVVYSPGLFGTSGWPALYGQMVPLPDERIIYSDHFYEPFLFTHQNSRGLTDAAGSRPYTLTAADIRARLQPLGGFASRTGAATYLGEFGAVVWAGWAPTRIGSSSTDCFNEPWAPRLDANMQPIFDNVSWLNDVAQAANSLGMAWTQFSFRTFEGWDSEFYPSYGPCGAYFRTPDNPTMLWMKRALQAP